MTDLVAFLEARLAEDEAVARAAEAEPFPDKGFQRGTHIAYGLQSTGLGLDYQGFALVWDPARVLAEIAAKREHLAMWHEGNERMSKAIDRQGSASSDLAKRSAALQRVQALGFHEATVQLLRSDVAIYAAHEDFDESWRA